MGRRTTAVPVPYKVTNFASDNFDSDICRALCGKKNNLSIVPNNFGDNGEHDPDCIDGLDFDNGWVYYHDSGMDYGFDDRVYCNELINDKKSLKVFVINESEFDGRYQISLFSDRDEDLKVLLNDLGRADLIIKNAVVRQTL